MTLLDYYLRKTNLLVSTKQGNLPHAEAVEKLNEIEAKAFEAGLMVNVDEVPVWTERLIRRALTQNHSVHEIRTVPRNSPAPPVDYSDEPRTVSARIRSSGVSRLDDMVPTYARAIYDGMPVELSDLTISQDDDNIPTYTATETCGCESCTN